MNPELMVMVAIFWIGWKPRCEKQGGSHCLSVTTLRAGAQGIALGHADISGEGFRDGKNGQNMEPARL
jgi:hypothetical protein